MSNEEALKKDLTPAEFMLFRDWIHRHSGIFLEDSKMDSLRISLVTRATRFDYTDYGDYFKFLSSDDTEFKELMNLVTINETSFFRFPAQFDAMRDKVIPEIMQGGGNTPRKFRVWSAGCSTGEEPYTIGMTLLDSALEPRGYTAEVVGTDVSTQALDRARRGVYPARSLSNLPAVTRQRWFEAVTDGHRPVQRVRDVCSFHFHNLIKEPYPLAFMSNWDIIFCRNVTIYFRVESTRRVVDHFFDALNPGGYLFIGHSETLTSISDRFEPVEIDGVFLYRKPHIKRGFTFQDIIERRRPASERAKEAPSDRRARMRAEAAQDASTEKKPPRKDKVIAAAEDKPVPAGERTVDALLAEARASLEAADANKALDLALAALERDPSAIDPHVVAAFAYADLGDIDAAIAQANDALGMNPLAAPARYILGVIKREQGDIPGSINEFKRTIYIDRDFVLAHFAVANILRSQGKTDEACRAYENTLRALYASPEGSWTAFLGGFKPDLLARTCERSLIECGRGPFKP